ncbi:MAG: DUF4093 domain-containing protein [Clostridia bacterium]|nr:DUF4093 domain-containing protein [Clostridia bacterium]
MQIREAIIVEGIYDKIKLSSIVDAVIIPTYGFSIFTDAPRLAYLRNLAKKRGLILLMDADAAGQKIRNFLEEQMPAGTVKNAYIPGIEGKEKRKNKPSAAGFLGVEGVPAEVIQKALSAVAHTTNHAENPITTADFYQMRLSGHADSNKRREQLAKALGLPPRLSGKALLAAVNAVVSRTEFLELCLKNADEG